MCRSEWQLSYHMNPVEVPLPGGGSEVMFLCMWYADQLVRTAAGWRMTRRVQEGCGNARDGITRRRPRLRLPDSVVCQ